MKFVTAFVLALLSFSALAAGGVVAPQPTDAFMIGAALFGMDGARWMVATVIVLVGALGFIGAWRLVNREVVRYGLVKVLLFAVVCVPFMHVAGDKTNRVENVGGGAEKQGGEYPPAEGCPRSGCPSRGASRRANVAELEAPPPWDTPRSGGTISNAFAFTAFSVSPSNACIALSWTTNYVFSAVGLYHRSSLLSNDSSRIDFRTDVANATNCAWTVTDPVIVTNKEAFFGARGFLADDDSDADGVVAQREIALGLDPDLADTDGDFLSDGEELGCATVLTGDDFLWLDVSNGLPNVTHYRAISGFFDFFWLMDEYPLSIQGVACNEFDVYENGFVIIARDSAGVEPSDGLWHENGDLRFDPRSGGATVVAAVNYDMLPTGTRCAGIVETNGTCYAVYKAESQTASIPGLSGDRSVTYEVIVPFNETNTVYVSYLDVDDAFTSLGMDLGVQCPSVLSAINTNELYTIPAPPGAFRSRATVKYVIGRNTDPRLLDSNGDGIPDGYSLVSPFDADGDGLVDSLDPEPAVYGGDFHGQSDAWVAATFTNANEILSIGYANWVDAQVGVGVANGLYKLSVSVTNMPITATRLAVGDYEVMIDEPCELVFLLEVFEDYEICVSSPLAADWSCDDGIVVGGETFEAHLAVPAPGVSGSLRLDPLVVVSPSEVSIGDASGTVLAATWNVASAVFTWFDQGGTAIFSEENTNTATIASALDATVLSVVATDGTHSATGTVAVIGPGGGAPSGETRSDASLGWSDGTHQTGTPPHPDTLRTTWVTVVGDRPAGETKETAASVTVPAGRTCYLGVFGRSTEHPEWTGEASRYNDALRWSVKDGTTPVLSGSCRVNALHEAFLAAADNGDSAEGESPVVFLGGAFHSAPTNAASTLSVSLRALNVGDGKRPSALALGVFPLTVYQANHPRATGGGGTTDSGLAGTNAVIVNCGVAYVTGEPEPAELLARIRDLPSWLYASWSGELTSERTERGSLDDRILAPNVTAGSASYNIKAALTNEVIGGRIDLTVQVSNTTEKTVSFFVRGKNALDAVARAYIDANVDEEFRSYAWMIAKHESKSGDRVYNQFNPSGARKELPNWGSPDGWGMCQIDRSANAFPNNVVLTSEVYNWKTNVISMSTVLAEKLSTCNRFVGYFRDAYGGLPCWQEPDNVVTNIGVHSVSAKDWAVLTLYNGVEGVEESQVSGRRIRSPIIFEPQSGTWKFCQNANNYVVVTVNDSDLIVEE